MDQEYQMVLLWCCIVLFPSLCRCLMNNKVWSSQEQELEVAASRVEWTEASFTRRIKCHIGTTSFTYAGFFCPTNDPSPASPSPSYAGFYCPTNDPSPASPSPRVCSNDTCDVTQNKNLSRSKAAMPRQEASRRYAIFEKKSACYDTKSPSDS